DASDVRGRLRGQNGDSHAGGTSMAEPTARRPGVAPRLGIVATATLAVLTAGLLAAPRSAEALTCIYRSAAEAVADADVVLVGSVRTYDTGGDAGMIPPSVPPSAEVVVEQYLKGDGPAVVTVVSHAAPWFGGW